MQRADLNVIEEGKAYQTLINDFEITHDECALQVGKDRSTVTNLIRMLSLPQSVQQHLLERKIYQWDMVELFLVWKMKS